MFGSFGELVVVVGLDEVVFFAEGIGAEATHRDDSFMGGVAIRFKFKNGFGISVVQHSGSYGGQKGLWEIAPLRTNGDMIDMPRYDDDFNDLPGTGENALLMEASGVSGDQVRGHLSTDEVVVIMDAINNLEG